MGIFDFFKKKKNNEPAYDPANIRLLDLQPGFMLDYSMKTWVVKKVFEFCWGSNVFSYEFFLDCGDEQCVLSVEERVGNLFVTVEKPVKIRNIDPNLPEIIAKSEVPPRQIIYDGITYLFDRESVGASRPDGASEDDWDDLITWDYYCKDDKHILCIEQWGESDFEAYVGVVVRETEFENLAPGSL